MTEGVVYDLGYVPHDGPRLGRGAAVRATIVDGLRRVLGLRRKARKKIFPWTLCSPSPRFQPSSSSDWPSLSVSSPRTPSHRSAVTPSTSTSAGTMVMIFAALAGPELLIPDRNERVLAVYSSRPMRAIDYLAARGAALGAVVGFFLLVPPTPHVRRIRLARRRRIHECRHRERR